MLIHPVIFFSLLFSLFSSLFFSLPLTPSVLVLSFGLLLYYLLYPAIQVVSCLFLRLFGLYLVSLASRIGCSGLQTASTPPSSALLSLQPNFCIVASHPTITAIEKETSLINIIRWICRCRHILAPCSLVRRVFCLHPTLHAFRPSRYFFLICEQSIVFFFFFRLRVERVLLQ